MPNSLSSSASPIHAGENVSACSFKRSAPASALALLLLSSALALSACRDSKIIWSAESPSPDGNWIAVARTDQLGGPGTAGLYTYVSLKRAHDAAAPIDIL